MESRVMKIIVEVDGCPLPLPPFDSLKVIVQPDPGESMELHCNFTHEGLITDLIDPLSDPTDAVGTSSETYTEMMDQFLEGEGEPDEATNVLADLLRFTPPDRTSAPEEPTD